ncbi:copper resistance protein CopC [Ammonicoccus fulvus]|uniref:Copper resistance protein CopC n=1 Tax=Ammonicoccus fulvus TaxID=3138240 RepID=A0ABZ3FK32_9ACTN
MNLVAASRRTPRRSLRATLLGVLIGFLLCWAGATPAWAHAELLGSSPADGAVLQVAPATVELDFSEAVQPVPEAARLVLSDGSAQPVAAVARDSRVTITLPDALGDGAYAVSYRILSADGHVVSGVVSFRVGAGEAPGVPTSAPSESTDLAAGLLGAAWYLGLFLVCGPILFDRTVRPGGTPHAVGFGSSLGIGAALALIPFGALSAAGPTPLGRGGLDAWLPLVQMSQVVSSGLTILGIVVVAVATRRDSPTTREVAVAGALIALISPVWVGHSATESPRWLVFLSDLAHLGAGAFWMGGVWALIGWLRGPGRTPRAVIGVVDRFSTAALVSVGALAASGTAMAICILDSPAALFSTAWGQLLLVKLGLVALVLAIAAWNRWRLLPRVRSVESHVAGVRLLARFLRLEALLLIGVLGVTGLVTSLSPRPVAAAETSSEDAAGSNPCTFHAWSQGLHVQGFLDPARGGRNKLTILAEFGTEYVKAPEIEVSARLPAQNLGPLTTNLPAAGDPGTYEGTVTLPVRGNWQFQVSAAVSTYEKPLVLAECVVS